MPAKGSEPTLKHPWKPEAIGSGGDFGKLESSGACCILH